MNKVESSHQLIVSNSTAYVEDFHVQLDILYIILALISCLKSH